ncbi:MAG: hypothetical protein ACOX2F_12940 [bacterium]
MGLIRGIAEAVMDKAKSEVKNYIVKFMEEEKKKEEKQQDKSIDESEVSTEPEESSEPTKGEVAPEEETVKKQKIYPLIKPEFTRITYKSRLKEFAVPSELAELAQMLPLEEFACFIKLLFFAIDQKKNFGYLGNTLRKKIGLESFESEKFDQVIDNLQEYGVLKIEQVSDNQRIFVLYLPFDEETMTKSQNQKQKSTPQKSEKKQPETLKKESKNEQSDIPGKAVQGMENEELYKSYRTFVSLEIDKAKMRVGRSNFDKIYMEAVKYIDKKYGFKVLSDSEKFKEYLTNYYISAFDIPTFEIWQKTKE